MDLCGFGNGIGRAINGLVRPQGALKVVSLDALGPLAHQTKLVEKSIASPLSGL